MVNRKSGVGHKLITILAVIGCIAIIIANSVALGFSIVYFNSLIVEIQMLGEKFFYIGVFLVVVKIYLEIIIWTIETSKKVLE